MAGDSQLWLLRALEKDSRGTSQAPVSWISRTSCKHIYVSEHWHQQGAAAAAIHSSTHEHSIHLWLMKKRNPRCVEAVIAAGRSWEPFVVKGWLPLLDYLPAAAFPLRSAKSGCIGWRFPGMLGWGSRDLTYQGSYILALPPAVPCSSFPSITAAPKAHPMPPRHLTSAPWLVGRPGTQHIFFHHFPCYINQFR